MAVIDFWLADNSSYYDYNNLLRQFIFKDR